MVEKKKRITNNQLMEKLEEIQKDNLKSNHLAIFAVGFAMIAVTIPIAIDLMNIPLYGQWLILILYFGIGFYMLFERLTKILKLNK